MWKIKFWRRDHQTPGPLHPETRRTPKGPSAKEEPTQKEKGGERQGGNLEGLCLSFLFGIFTTVGPKVAIPRYHPEIAIWLYFPKH